MAPPASRPAPAPSATLAFFALLLGASAIGFGPIFVRIADVGPVSSAFWRVALTIPVFLVWVRSFERPRPRVARPRVLLACGVFFAADLGLWHWSITLTSVANATLLANLNSVFVALFGFVLFRERFTPLFLFSLVLALGGAGMLMGSSVEFAPERVPGDILGVATAVMYASYILAAKLLRERYSAAEVLLYTAIVTSAVLLPVAWLSGERILPATPQGWWPLVALALFSQVLGQGLIVFALAHLPAAFSALTLLVQPIVAAAVAWRLFGEALGALELAGAGVILAGIVLARTAARRG